MIIDSEDRADLGCIKSETIKEGYDYLITVCFNDKFMKEVVYPVYIDPSVNENYNKYCSTYLHELCHVYGAKDTYCNRDYNQSGFCSNLNCVSYHKNLGYSEYCIMDNWDTKPIIIGDDAVNIDDYLCDKCKEDIRNHLN